MLPGRHTEVRLTRAELEAMLRPALEETVAATTRRVAHRGTASLRPQSSGARRRVEPHPARRAARDVSPRASGRDRHRSEARDRTRRRAPRTPEHCRTGRHHLTEPSDGGRPGPRTTARGCRGDDSARVPSAVARSDDAAARATADRVHRAAADQRADPDRATALLDPASVIDPAPIDDAASVRPASQRADDPGWSASSGPSKGKRTGLLIGAGVVVVALLAGGVAVLAGGGGGGDDSGTQATGTTVATDDTTSDGGADTTAVTDGGDISDPLEAGLLSSLDFESVTGAVTLQGAVTFPSDVLCDADGVIGTSSFVDYRSRLFADNPDFSGKKAATGAIEFPDSDAADAFLEQLNNFGASHVVTDECPLTQVDFFDGTVAFKETPAGGGDQGAIGFAKVDPDVVVFVGVGDPTGMDPSEVQFLVQEQKQKMGALLNGDSGGADTSTLATLQGALLTPDDVGTGFDQTITSVDPEVDYLCFSTPSADRSAATEVDEQLFGPDGTSEVAIVTLSFPDAATAATYLADTEAFIDENIDGGCALTVEPTDALEAVHQPRRRLHLDVRWWQRTQPSDLGEARERGRRRDRQPADDRQRRRPRGRSDEPHQRRRAHHGLNRVSTRRKESWDSRR